MKYELCNFRDSPYELIALIFAFKLVLHIIKMNVKFSLIIKIIFLEHFIANKKDMPS